jgi:hypothetical protein
MSSIPETSDMAPEKKEIVLVTGGTGYIASHVIEQLVKAGYAGEWGLCKPKDTFLGGSSIQLILLCVMFCI